MYSYIFHICHLHDVFLLLAMRRRQGPLGGYTPQYRRHRIAQRTTSFESLAVPVAPQPIYSVAQSSEPEAAEDKELPELSRHYQRKQAEVEQWGAIRTHVQTAAYDTACPATATCQICRQIAVRILKCGDCGPQYSGCEECVLKDHTYRPLHSLQMWQVGASSYSTLKFAML